MNQRILAETELLRKVYPGLRVAGRVATGCASLSGCHPAGTSRQSVSHFSFQRLDILLLRSTDSMLLPGCDLSLALFQILQIRQRRNRHSMGHGCSSQVIQRSGHPRPTLKVGATFFRGWPAFTNVCTRVLVRRNSMVVVNMGCDMQRLVWKASAAAAPGFLNRQDSICCCVRRRRRRCTYLQAVRATYGAGLQLPVELSH